MKLHIGGETKKEGWKVLNIQPGLFVDYIGDIRDLSQFDENSIEEIYASHVLEHIEQNQTLEALKGIFRVLKKKWKVLCFSSRFRYFVQNVHTQGSYIKDKI